MRKENFLNTLDLASLRERLYKLFNHAESEAKSFAVDFSNWVHINKVTQNSNGICRWHESGYITIDPVRLSEKDDLGAMFHEIFHSAFHKCPLWYSDVLNKNKYNGYGEWGEAFCDTFRYFMEEELFCGTGKYFLKISEGYLKRNPNEILKSTNDKCHDIKHAVPASILIDKADSYEDFRKLWAELNKAWQALNPKDENFLEAHFKFSMKKLQRRYRC